MMAGTAWARPFDKLNLQVNREINLGTSHSAFIAELMGRVFLSRFCRFFRAAETFAAYQPPPFLGIDRRRISLGVFFR
jgi:hypothetical protein